MSAGKRARAEAANGAADESLADEMIKLIDASPTPFHLCAEGSAMLVAAGFVELDETDNWRPLLAPGGKYFFVRGGTLVAFFVGAAFKVGNGFNIVGAHTDSPVLKLKPCSKKNAHGCIQINVEAYGGGLWHTWFDRELSLAGAVIVREKDGAYCKKLVHVKRPLLRIPNLCIHLTSAEDRGKFAPNKETHLQVCAHRRPDVPAPRAAPLACASCSAPPHTSTPCHPARSACQHTTPLPTMPLSSTTPLSTTPLPTTPLSPRLTSARPLSLPPRPCPQPILGLISEAVNKTAASEADPSGMGARHAPELLRIVSLELGCDVADIMDFEMTLYDTQPSQVWGLSREFLSAPRLDNQMHCFTALKALLAQAEGAPPTAPDICLIALFDHEEVGSDSSTGAGGPIMCESLQRISSCFAADEPHASAEALRISTRRSFLMSADSAHAVHPNYAEKHQAAHAPLLNRGTVIKTNDNQRYATNGESGFVVRELARVAGIGVQEFMVKNDCPCGSTIGPILSSKTVRYPRALPTRAAHARCPRALSTPPPPRHPMRRAYAAHAAQHAAQHAGHHATHAPHATLADARDCSPWAAAARRSLHHVLRLAPVGTRRGCVPSILARAAGPCTRSGRPSASVTLRTPSSSSAPSSPPSPSSTASAHSAARKRADRAACRRRVGAESELSTRR